jgi:uncharacterized membrane protein YidH (DUF202 family)
MSFLSRFSTPIYKNTGSTARDHLASERTYLAWLRTGLGFIALGIAVERFSQLDLQFLLQPPTNQFHQSDKKHNERETGREQLLVATLLGTGTGSIAYGTTRYFRTMRMLERGLFQPAYHGAAVLGVVVAGIAGARARRTNHTTDHSTRSWIDWEKKTRMLDLIIEMHPTNPRLDDYIKIVFMESYKLIHVCKVYTDSSVWGAEVAFKGRSSRVWNHGDLEFCTYSCDLCD